MWPSLPNNCFFNSSRIVPQSDGLHRSWLTTSNLWHGLSVFSLFQCSQPSPGVTGFAVRKKVSCEQAHLVRVLGALVRNPTTQGCSQARKKVPSCHSLGRPVIFTERGLKSSTKSRLVSEYHGSVQCIWHIHKCKLIRSLKQGLYTLFIRWTTGLPSEKLSCVFICFFFQNPPLLFLLSVLRLGPVLKKFRRPGVTQFQWTVVTKFWRKFNFVDWRLFVFCGN